MGLVAENSRSTQRLMLPPPPLTVSGVFTKFCDIARLTGSAVSRAAWPIPKPRYPRTQSMVGTLVFICAYVVYNVSFHFSLENIASNAMSPGGGTLVNACWTEEERQRELASVS